MEVIQKGNTSLSQTIIGTISQSKTNLILYYGLLKILTLLEAIGKKERRVLATQIMMIKPFLKIWLIDTNRYLLLRNS